jgi:hypothetical protein
MHTDRSGIRVETVLNQLFDNGAKVDNHLPGLDLVNLCNRIKSTAVPYHVLASKSIPSEPRWP